MKIKYIIWSTLAALTLTLAGCNTGSGVFIDKRIERTKLLNQINANVDEAKRLNDEIDNNVGSAQRKSIEIEMDKVCPPREREKLGKYETCYVSKLKEIRDKNDRAAVSKAHADCYKKEGKADFKPSPTCEIAIMKLTQMLDKFSAPAKS